VVSQAGFASIAFGWESFDRTVRRRDAGSLPYSSRVEIEGSIRGYGVRGEPRISILWLTMNGIDSVVWQAVPTLGESAEPKVQRKSGESGNKMLGGIRAPVYQHRLPIGDELLQRSIRYRGSNLDASLSLPSPQ